MLEKHELNSMFYPKSIALVGASPNPQGWGGTSFLLRVNEYRLSRKNLPDQSQGNRDIGFKGLSESAFPPRNGRSGHYCHFRTGCPRRYWKIASQRE